MTVLFFLSTLTHLLPMTPSTYFEAYLKIKPPQSAISQVSAAATDDTNEVLSQEL